MAAERLRVGFLANPVAGLGGRAGLKGSDDASRIEPLLSALAYEETNAFDRGFTFFAQLEPEGRVLVTAPGPLGEDVLKQAVACGGPIFEVAREPDWDKAFGATTRDDTQRFVRRLLRAQIDLLVFVGGDGTAVDVAQAAGDAVPLLGVPAGVKMFSGVFAQTASQAGLIVNQLRPGFATRSVDVLDLDEESYRAGSWIVAHQAVARVPDIEGVPVAKGGSSPLEAESEADLVAWFEAWVRPEATLVLGAGSTLGALKRHLGAGSPLGVDVVKGGRFLAVDADEATLLQFLEGAPDAWILVSPTGNQGCLLGRGTAQISPEVVQRVGVDRVLVLATPGKLLGLRELFVDTGDPALDRAFPEYVRIRTDPWTEKVFPVRKGAPTREPVRGPHGR